MKHIVAMEKRVPVEPNIGVCREAIEAQQSPARGQRSRERAAIPMIGTIDIDCTNS
jgi:hypothetical protein